MKNIVIDAQKLCKTLWHHIFTGVLAVAIDSHFLAFDVSAVDTSTDIVRGRTYGDVSKAVCGDMQ